MGDQLGDHRIVERRDLAARFDAGVDAQAFALRELQRQQPAGRGQKAALGVLGVKPRLDRVAVERHLRLRERELFAGRDAELPFHQIEPGHGFGHRMLDLQPRVHLHEPEAGLFEPAGAVGDEFDRAGALITGGLGGGDSGFAHAGAQASAHARRRRLLDHFLMAALQGAIALVEMDGVAVAVGENLHLDVARRGDVFLDQHALVAEGRFRLALGPR